MKYTEESHSIHSNLSRRSFLKTSALAAGALAAAGSIGCSSIDTSGKAASESETTASERSVICTCRGNCGSACTLDVTVRDGKIVSSMPRTYSREYEGVNEGCVKGISAAARVYSPARLLHPMLQTGERGSDEWEVITWDEALAMIAEKFQTAFDTHGSKSVAVWQGAGNSNSFLNIAPFNISNRAPSNAQGVGLGRFLQKTGCTYFGVTGDQAGMYMLFYMLNTPKSSLEELQNAKTLVVWGSNPAAASLSKNSWYWMCKARENGAKIICIDPLYTETAAKADLWLPIRVGTDAALMLAMANYIISHDLADIDYMKNGSVAPLLVKGDGSYLRLSDLGLADVDSEDDVPVVWDEATQDFAAHNAAIDPALHGTRSAEDESARTVLDLSLESIEDITIEFAQNECGLSEDAIMELIEACVHNKPTFLSIDWGIEHTYNAFRLYYASALLASTIGGIGTTGFGYSTPNSCVSSIIQGPISKDTSDVIMADAIPNATICGDWIPHIVETGAWAGEDMTIDCLYIQAANPLDNHSGPVDMIKAWEKIPFIVTADLMMTTTAHYSDLVLPVAMSFESEDWIERGFMNQKAVEPAGEAKTDFEIWCSIASEMGLSDLYAKSAEEYLRTYLDTPENLAAGLGYGAWHEQGVIVGEYSTGSSPAPEYNPLGRTQFYVEEFLARDEQGLQFPDTDRLPYYERAIESYADNPLREKYPLYGFFNHDNYHGQCCHAHNVLLDEFRTYEGSPYCKIHESAAAERGIETGDKVRVFNDRGHVVLKAVLTKGIQEESVLLPHGFFWDEYEDGWCESLTGFFVDPQTANANFNDLLVQVEKFDGGVA